MSVVKAAELNSEKRLKNKVWILLPLNRWKCLLMELADFKERHLSAQQIK